MPEAELKHFGSPANFLVSPDPAPQNEPAVAVHLLDPGIMVAAANDYRESGFSQIGIYRSEDAGHTWTNFIPPLPRGHFNSGDPVVCYGYPNLFLVGGAAYKSAGEEGGGSIVVYRSEDGGITFEQPVIIQEGFNEQTFNDKPWFAVDTAPASPYQGRAYVIYTRFMNPGTRIFFHRSEDGGRTWSEPIPLTGIDPYSLGTFVAIGQLGEVYVAWIDNNPKSTLVFRRSLDGGRTFDAPVTIASFTAPVNGQGLEEFVPEFTFRMFTFAFLGTDQTTGPEGGRVYAVWQQFRRRTCRRGRSKEILDIMISVSEDRGATWSRPRKVTGTPSWRLSFFPFISVSPTTGTVHIVYYTNRVARDKLDLFLVRLDNHGRRYQRNERVTDQSFDPNADPFGTAFIGDYIGCAARPDEERAVAVWCDTRRGTEDIFAAPQA